MAPQQILLKSVALAGLLMIALGGSDARSQGATGGSLGNDNKSLSGSSSEPRAARPAHRERSEQRAAPARRGSSGDGGGSAARFDGTWLIAFIGQSSVCAGKTASSTLTISGGSVGGGGSISPSGVLQGVGSSGSVSAVMTGRLSGRSGGGSMQMSNGCSGRWTASRQ
ncbi:hypothetical protein E0H22_12185 [Rhodopseudomonas boonkerdii]|uniref:hypothetical protein n=1 Tax=Rhodopseudomonas boonkerdii TaxID=475937 RepID=UPI001E3D4AE7|nr:hypothetical protein [Rhodopseudomonas boonkerdii]UGV26382.1 hypothetical protein E0H22_12185 [Rhodopseudomonas boonkerdii]